MYWWKAGKLAEDLREGRVTERERFKYYLATFIAWNLIAELYFYYGGALGMERLIIVPLNLGLMVAGTIRCYRLNKGGDNKDFIVRMICLGWPIGIQIIVIILAMFLLLFVATLPLDSPRALREAIGRGFPSGLGTFFIVFYYFQLYVYLSTIAEAKRAEENRLTADAESH